MKQPRAQWVRSVLKANNNCNLQISNRYSVVLNGLVKNGNERLRGLVVGWRSSSLFHSISADKPSQRKKRELFHHRDEVEVMSPAPLLMTGAFSTASEVQQKQLIRLTVLLLFNIRYWKLTRLDSLITSSCFSGSVWRSFNRGSRG